MGSFEPPDSRFALVYDVRVAPHFDWLTLLVLFCGTSDWFMLVRVTAGFSSV